MYYLDLYYMYNSLCNINVKFDVYVVETSMNFICSPGYQGVVLFLKRFGCFGLNCGCHRQRSCTLVVLLPTLPIISGQKNNKRKTPLTMASKVEAETSGTASILRPKRPEILENRTTA